MPAAQPIARMRKEFPRLSAFTWSHPLWIALASILAETEVAPQWFRVLGPVLLALPLIFSEEEARADRENPDLMQALSGLPQGAPVGFLATENAIA